eukprot:TRINITY_DN3739_c0_g1_i3.p1 TRINITY_DN3739_c0_g1~~TRINITY_DN3739_c0_g1_i3.p1  ORF type:complete len:206 (-),score=41.33 TRINITY_DN3739_c0_g1_i3:16-633(-)
MASESTDFDQQAKEITDVLGDHAVGESIRIAVIGSGSFFGEDSEKVCTSVGEALTKIPNVTLITGGISGVGEGVGRAFYQHKKQGQNVFHVLPRPSPSWDYGVTLKAGNDMFERREILGRLCPIYIVIEGGPGTVHEAEVAQAHGGILIPIGRTGGCSAELHRDYRKPSGVQQDKWDRLGTKQEDATQVGDVVVEIVRALMTDRK